MLYKSSAGKLAGTLIHWDVYWTGFGLALLSVVVHAASGRAIIPFAGAQMANPIQ